MFTIPYSLVKKFRYNNAHKRWGEAFCNFIKFDLSNPEMKAFHAELFEEPDDIRAKAMVVSKIDYNK